MAKFESIGKIKESVGKPAGSGKGVEFSLTAPAAKKVSIAGTFNGWDAGSLPMKKEKDGTWKIRVKLTAGKHEYKYVVDGAWTHDAGSKCVQNSFGSYNSVIEINS